MLRKNNVIHQVLKIMNAFKVLKFIYLSIISMTRIIITLRN